MKIATSKFIEVANKYGFEMNSQSIHRSISQRLSHHEIWAKNIDQLFANLDKDKNGKIEIAEIKRYLRKCCGQTKEQSREASKYLITAFDRNGDHIITKEEFVSHFDEMDVDSAKKGITHALKLYDDYRHRRDSNSTILKKFSVHLTELHDKGKEKHVRV